MKLKLSCFLMAALFCAISVAQPPVTTLVVQPPTVEHPNNVTVTWTTEHAIKVTLDGADVALNGSKVITAPAVGQHTVTLIAIGDNSTKTTTYTVVPKPPEPEPPTLDPNLCICSDPLLKKEHEAAMRLMPLADVTNTVLTSGLYTNPDTWGGALPVDGAKIHIPVNRTLIIDTETARIKWMRVDGTLTELVDKAARLQCEYLFGTAPAKWIVDKADPNFQSKYTIINNGPLDPLTDPFQFGCAIIWHGTTEIKGAAKKTWTRFSSAPIGATQITVADVTGWMPGDRLVIPQNAVEFASYAYHVRNRDDDVRIAEIGVTELGDNVVLLDSPLKFAHTPIEATIQGEVIKKDPIVMNMTRNIVIESETPGPATGGHTLFMHNPKIKVHYVAFNGLGRTDKSKQVTDPNGTGGGLANVRGRYSFHLHRTGIHSEPVDVLGIAIDGFPGWGGVNHDANANFDWCVSYGGFGSAFITELGNEKGSFTNCCAARVDGVGRPDELRVGNDAGHSGDGFWLEGAGVAVNNNVVIACKKGITFFQMFGAGLTCKNNECLFNSSLIVWDVGGNGIGSPPYDPVNNIEGNFVHGSIDQGYSSRITYKDNTLVAFHPKLSLFGYGHTGVNTHIHHINNKVVNYVNGVLMPTEGENKVEGGYYDNLEVDLYIQQTQGSRSRRIDIANVTFGPKAIWNVEMRTDCFASDWRPAYPRGPYQSTRPVPPYQALFAVPNSALGHPASLVTLNGKKLFFEEQGSAYEFGKMFTRFPVEIRFEPDGTTLATTASLAARGKIVGGEPLPAGTQSYLPKVRGVLVGE